ncbi:predicted protein [Plenodomus lingam JN3]|uniref:Predicted protein n=1 Tax=Leptosphaeria maculans (strain JN3 / isolate v23.1.3 / race Av1-4-5-6-7-8) TaxID=985895 RepID=E4ZHQ4_LEPMJ|nr:predicted protein [Plenodomus lingam JN3]CBX90887.1 predicted protein [Plenodomus lingam JN3]
MGRLFLEAETSKDADQRWIGPRKLHMYTTAWPFVEIELAPGAFLGPRAPELFRLLLY